MQKTTDNIYLLIILGIGGSFLMVASFILIYVRNQNKLLKQRQQLQYAEIAHQKGLLNAVIESQENERKRIGRDLHDDVGTALSSLRLVIEMFDSEKQTQGHQQFITSSKNLIDKIMIDVRNISHSLSPSALTYYGLSFAIEEQCEIINQSDKLAIVLINEAKDFIEKLSLPVSTAIYRVIEELLNNTMKHAKANSVTIKLINDNNVLTIEYSDNGQGMDPELINKGMGLQNIESRLTIINAPYSIATAPGKGFNIKINYSSS